MWKFWNNGFTCIIKSIGVDGKEYQLIVLVFFLNNNEISFFVFRFSFVIFEFDTIRYDPELFVWEWNKNGNLRGVEKSTTEHRFTWQPHGSQFTIIEEIPEDSLLIKIKEPEMLNKEDVLKALGFDKSWISITKRS